MLYIGIISNAHGVDVLVKLKRNARWSLTPLNYRRLVKTSHFAVTRLCGFTHKLKCAETDLQLLSYLTVSRFLACMVPITAGLIADYIIVSFWN